MTHNGGYSRKIAPSFAQYLRDVLIYYCPFPLPNLIRNYFLGVKPQFIFLGHPRNKDDILLAYPFFRLLRRFLPTKKFYQFMSLFPPAVLSPVRTPSGIDGLFITSSWIPDLFFKNRRGALLEIRRCLKFSSKLLTKRNCYVGLGGWWPLITRRGHAVQSLAHQLDIQITTGHCGTLCSLYLTLLKLAKIGEVPLEELTLCIVGVGKMGQNVVKLLDGKVRKILLVDINVAKTQRFAAQISPRSCTDYEILLGPSAERLPRMIQNSHITIFTTSNLRKILPDRALPDATIILDDSRPEAVARSYDEKRGVAVLEGGLLKIPNVRLDYDFGFGVDGNVFGCLGETYLLACDKGRKLVPTLGEVDFENLWNMFSVAKELGVREGDLKSGNRYVVDKVVQNIFRKKLEHLSGKVGLCNSNFESTKIMPSA